MKKTISIFIALLLLFNTVGMLVFYWGAMENCEHLATKEIALHRFEADELIHFSAHNKNFQLIEDKEILSEGILYDIVKTENKGGEIIYSCLSDQKESGFWNGIAQLAKGNTEPNSSPVKADAPEVLKYIGQEISAVPAYIYLQSITLSGFRNKSTYYQNPFNEITAPPPKV